MHILYMGVNNHPRPFIYAVCLTSQPSKEVPGRTPTARNARNDSPLPPSTDPECSLCRSFRHLVRRYGTRRSVIGYVPPSSLQWRVWWKLCKSRSNAGEIRMKGKHFQIQGDCVGAELWRHLHSYITSGLGLSSVLLTEWSAPGTAPL